MLNFSALQPKTKPKTKPELNLSALTTKKPLKFTPTAEVDFGMDQLRTKTTTPQLLPEKEPSPSVIRRGLSKVPETIYAGVEASKDLLRGEIEKSREISKLPIEKQALEQAKRTGKLLTFLPREIITGTGALLKSGEVMIRKELGIKPDPGIEKNRGVMEEKIFGRKLTTIQDIFRATDQFVKEHESLEIEKTLLPYLSIFGFALVESPLGGEFKVIKNLVREGGEKLAKELAEKNLIKEASQLTKQDLVDITAGRITSGKKLDVFKTMNSDPKLRQKFSDIIQNKKIPFTQKVEDFFAKVVEKVKPLDTKALKIAPEPVRKPVVEKKPIEAPKAPPVAEKVAKMGAIEPVKQKTQFISPQIRPLSQTENIILPKIKNVLTGQSSQVDIADIPKFLSKDNKVRPLIFNESIAQKIKIHGELIPENLIINANDWDGVLKNVRIFKDGKLSKPDPNKINLIKKIPNSDNFLMIGANKTDGFFMVTHYEVIPKKGNELKSLLGRGNLLSPDGTPLGPKDFLTPPPAVSGFKGVSGRADISKVAEVEKEVKASVDKLAEQAIKKEVPKTELVSKEPTKFRPEVAEKKPSPEKIVQKPTKDVPPKISSLQKTTTSKKISQVAEEQPKLDKTPPEKALTESTNWDGHLELPKETKWQAFRRQIEDFNIRLKILNNKVEEVAGKPIKENLDLWAQKDMLPRKQSDLIRRINKEKQDFVKELTANDIKVAEFDKFLHAQHAIERNAQMNKLRVERGKEPVDGLSGMTNEEANKILTKATPEMKTLASKVRKMTDDILDFEVEKGLMKSSEAEIYRETYKNYVPLYRDVDDAVFTGIGQGISIVGKETKRATGSLTRVTSPLGNIFYRKERAQVRALKNEIGKTIIETTKEYPFLKDMFKIEKQKYLPRFNKEGELQWLDPKFKFGDNVIGAKIDGTQYFITVADSKVAQALKSLNLARVPKFVQHLRTAIGIWSSFKTRWRPEFLITNFERDLGEALVNLGVEKGMLKEARRGLRKDVIKGLFPSQKQVWQYLKGKKDLVADEFFKLGGDTGHFWAENALKSEKSLIKLEKELTNQGIEKIKNPIRKAGEVIDHIQSMVELGVRFSSYKALTKRGMSKEKAIQRTSDLTINFSRQGEISPFLKSFYGFINPAIQGSSKVFRSITSKEGQKRVIGALVALASLGFLTRTMSIMLDKEGDEQISDWAKNHKLTFAIGDGKQITLWNMPYGYSTFYAMGSNVSEMMFKQKTVGEALSGVLDTTIDSFSPFQTSLNSFIPTLAKPIFEINQNKNWYDGKVYPDQVFTKTPKPDFETYFNNTSQTAIFITELLNKLTGGKEGKAGLIDVHPNSLEYAFNQFTGGPFEFVMSAVESGARGLDGEFDENKTPFVRQFVRQGKPQSFSYKVIYDTLEQAWKKDLSVLEKERFYKAVDIGLKEKVFDQDRADGYIQDFLRAQYQIQGTITDNVDKINEMSPEDRTRLVDTYAESTQKKLNKLLEEPPKKKSDELFPPKGEKESVTDDLFPVKN